MLAVVPDLWWLALADLVIHASVDRGSALFALRVPWRTDQPRFRWLHGVDQGQPQPADIGLPVAVVLP